MLYLAQVRDVAFSDAPTSAPVGTRDTQRSQSPVFVVGCHRSGTNLLYDTLLSAGGFAVYRGYLPIHKILIPRVGPLDKLENRKNAVALWVRSKGFRRSGLDAQELTDRLLRDCRNGGEFIRLTMDAVSRKQNVSRWAVYDPDAALHIPRIKAEIPEALFVHIIRDGRDIAVSLNKMGGFMPFFWNRKPGNVLATAAYWEWTVRRSRQHGRQIPGDYMELHYEDLVTDPQSTLGALGEFLNHDLNYERIRQASLGRLRESNSSFREETAETQENPVGRWKGRLSHQEVAELEALIGRCLEEVGYSLTIPEQERKRAPQHKLMRILYATLLSSKFWLKHRTPLGQFADVSALELDGDAATSQSSTTA